MSIVRELAKSFKPDGQLEPDVRTFFESRGLRNIAGHTAQVAENAAMLAEQFCIGRDLPVTAALVHDLGWVLTGDQAILAVEKAGIDLFDEERQYPGLLHQRTSKILAAELFKIENAAVLDAVECHTTLKAGASDLDLLLFVADKLTWNTPDSQPILNGIRAGLDQSLAHAAFNYIRFSVEHSKTMPVLHPWMRAAYEDLKQKCT